MILFTLLFKLISFDLSFFDINVYYGIWLVNGFTSGNGDVMQI